MPRKSCSDSQSSQVTPFCCRRAMQRRAAVPRTGSRLVPTWLRSWSAFLSSGESPSISTCSRCGGEGGRGEWMKGEENCGGKAAANATQRTPPTMHAWPTPACLPSPLPHQHVPALLLQGGIPVSDQLLMARQVLHVGVRHRHDAAGRLLLQQGLEVGNGATRVPEGGEHAAGAGVAHLRRRGEEAAGENFAGGPGERRPTKAGDAAAAAGLGGPRRARHGPRRGSQPPQPKQVGRRPKSQHAPWGCCCCLPGLLLPAGSWRSRGSGSTCTGLEGCRGAQSSSTLRAASACLPTAA